MLSCVSDSVTPPRELTETPPAELAEVWRAFLALPTQRALAIAGNPRQDRWVTAASAGHATREQAEAEALSECRVRRGMRRMQAECVLYAVGNEIVWRGR
ncbi:MAG: hypothetical protein JRD03_03295 [Deltaproteobacteria bacterium]|nr:hypothetical protein [Deltaproteobacteria bacterium]